MYSNKQVQPLIELIEAWQNAKDDDKAIVMTDISKHVAMLKAAGNQNLVLGTHDHRHGTSTYLFLVPEANSFGVKEFEQELQEEFEPDRDEELGLSVFKDSEVQVIDPR